MGPAEAVSSLTIPAPRPAPRRSRRRIHVATVSYIANSMGNDEEVARVARGRRAAAGVLAGIGFLVLLAALYGIG